MVEINDQLVGRLIGAQFPQWSDLPVAAVEQGGWDNRMFRLGREMVIRLPSAACYEAQIDKEQRWLPKLAPCLPVAVPTPVGLGRPGCGYEWHWSVYRWIDGARLHPDGITNRGKLAVELALFLKALQLVDIKNAPQAGLHNFHRGGSLRVYDAETREAVELLAGELDSKRALELWAEAMNTSWASDPVWVHGDFAEGNLLERDGSLCAVIDFGCMAIGDPACDLVIAWTFLERSASLRFRNAMGLDAATWRRAQAWALWKALITLVQARDVHPAEALRQRSILSTILEDGGA